MRWLKGSQSRMMAAAVIVAVVAWSSPASADDKPVEPGEPPDAIMLAQQPLVEAAQAITALDKERTGLGGIRLQVEKGAVEVWWKGTIPDAVRKEIAAREKAGVHIVLGNARYNGAELSAAQDRIVQNRDRYPQANDDFC